MRHFILVAGLLVVVSCSTRHEFQYVEDAPGKGEASADTGPVDLTTADAQEADSQKTDASDLTADVHAEITSDAPDVCTPQCDGRECGDDGCDGSCGECGDDGVCQEGGKCFCLFIECQDVCCADGEQCFQGSCCAADCEGRECGDDGCGGSCGECEDGQICGEGGSCACEFVLCLDACCADGEVCFEEACCAPDCENKSCGGDGCGAGCGECAEDYECIDAEGAAACQALCDQLCEGLECGTAGIDDECECGMCGDGNDCTDDVCSGEQLCTYPDNAIECDDGNPCTDGDVCGEGVCAGELLAPEELAELDCLCMVDEDCVSVENGDICDGTLVCKKENVEDESGVCEVDEATILSCVDAHDCTTDSCDSELGCLFEPDDEACDDSNVCTDDTCSTETGCVFTNNELPCDDLSVCTVDDKCAESLCVPGAALPCDDLVDCTENSCDALEGCKYTPDNTLCDDIDPCTDDSCDMTLGCQYADSIAGCDDFDNCTVTDVCFEGVCSGTPVICDDELFCNGVESCDPADGECVAANVPQVDDSVVCTVDSCDEENDMVLNLADNALCDDLDDCTADLCVAGQGCSYATVPDGTVCAADLGGHQCSNGQCVCDSECTDRQCGNDGCGGSCGECEAGFECDEEFGACHAPGWVTVKAGTYLQGSPDSESCHETTEGPRRPVTLTRDLLVSDHETTQGEWLAVMPDGTPNPSYFGPDGDIPFCTDGACPVERVNWFEALKYANELSLAHGVEPCYALGNCTGNIGSGCVAGKYCDVGTYTCGAVAFKGLNCLGYRLPTEAEWEYLARGGVDSAFAYPLSDGSEHTGDCESCHQEPAIDDFAWYCHNASQHTHKIGLKAPNGFGLYDTAGNVSEWIFDGYWNAYYLHAPDVDPINSSLLDFHVLRGGSYISWPKIVRSAARLQGSRAGRASDWGVRLVRTLPTAACVPDCEGRECGNDGCGGSCGACLEGTCNEDFGECSDAGWVLVPPGEFLMGSLGSEPCHAENESPVHQVVLTHPLSVLPHEVTHGEWESLTGLPSPGYFGPNGPEPECTAASCPVDRVSWYDALAYCNLLSAQEGLEECYQLSDCTGEFGAGCADNSQSGCDGYECTAAFTGVHCLGYRLPTEAEWEYLARAGTTTSLAYPPPDGTDLDESCADCPADDVLWDYGWYCQNGFYLEHETMQLAPNGWGLYDMSGNVAEWVWDWAAEDYYSSSPLVDPTGPDWTGSRSVRGGSYGSVPGSERSAARAWQVPHMVYRGIGFRVVRSLAAPDCEPQCGNRQCGEDGCGGTCGECGAGKECSEEFGACVAGDWVYVPGGTFQMGLSEDNPCVDYQHSAMPQHQVTITRPLLVSDHETTVEEWETITGHSNPSWFHGAGTCVSQDCPVESVSWYEALRFANSMSQLDGLETCYELSDCAGIFSAACYPDGFCDGYSCSSVVFKGVDCPGYRLPTEAEWEYVARGGTSAPYPFPPPFGGAKNPSCTGDGEELWEPNLEGYAWHWKNSAGTVHPTRTVLANSFGLYDVAGNVAEWNMDSCPTASEEMFYPPEPAVDPVVLSGVDRRARGGAFGAGPMTLMSPARSHYAPAKKDANVGFRLVRTLLCRSGDIRTCGTSEGTCQTGVQTCVDGVWGACEGEVPPDPALCMGRECGGDDGCGGTCGECVLGQSCHEESGMCIKDDWVYVPGGTFTMGSPIDEPCHKADEEPQHEVTITRDLLVSNHEFSAAEWEIATGSPSPTYWKEGNSSNLFCVEQDCPVDMVNWFEYVHLANKLSQIEGLEECYELTCTGELGGGCEPDENSCAPIDDFVCGAFSFKGLDCTGYRLPTEAEWEYLARAGTTAAYAYPPDTGSAPIAAVGHCIECVEEPALNDYVVYCGTPEMAGGPEAVAQLLPNAFGLFDMHGNLQEWVMDSYEADYYANSPLEDPMAPLVGAGLARGGDWGAALRDFRSADRNTSWGRVWRNRHTGARFVRSVEKGGE